MAFMDYDTLNFINKEHVTGPNIMKFLVRVIYFYFKYI